MKVCSNLIIRIALVATAMASQPAAAVDAARSYWDQGGSACQLSVPTTTSLVRPRATGMRNEGTSNQFVICQIAGTSDVFTSAAVRLVSIDGASHSVSCTGANGNLSAGLNYSTIYVSTGSSTTLGSVITWFPANFGSSTSTFKNAMFSITCNLPAGAAVMFVTATYNEYIGA